MLQRRIPSPEIVVMASGNGSNFEAIVRASREGILEAHVTRLIVDRDCYAQERAKKLGIPCTKLSKKWVEELEKVLEELNPSLVVLAGFMRIIPARIVKRWRWKMINIHPALLPAFPGMHAIEKAYEHGVKVTGITIHFVDEGVDTGPIILQKAIEIDPRWTLEDLEGKIHEMEHKWYPRTIQLVLSGKWRVEGRRVVIEENTGQSLQEGRVSG